MTYWIRILAIITAATALYVLLPYHWLWFFLQWFEGLDIEDVDFFYYIRIHYLEFCVMILAEIILYLKLVTAYGLFKFKPWGRGYAIYVLFCDFLLKMWIAIDSWADLTLFPKIYKIYDEGTRRMAVDFTSSLSISFSLVIAALSLVSASILFIAPINAVFKPNSLEDQNV